MSKTFLGEAVCQEFKPEAPVAEEMLDRVVCSREQFSFQMCLESGDYITLKICSALLTKMFSHSLHRNGSGTFRNWRQRVPDSWYCMS